MATSRRSFAHQTLHYFARPHQGVRRQPLSTPAAWRGDDFTDDEWIESLSAAQLDEIEAGLDHACAVPRPTGALQREDFPLPT